MHRRRFIHLVAGSAVTLAADTAHAGTPTYWANRLNLPIEQLDFEPDATGGGAADLVKFVT